MARVAVNIYEAKTQLSRLVDQAAAGQEIIIARGGKPIAKLGRLTPKPRRVRFGVLKGKLRIPADFDAPLPDAILAAFAGR